MQTTENPARTKGQNFFGSQWKFDRHGHSGLWISELFPHTAKVADELCILNGMHTDNPEHGAALTQLHTGSFVFDRPSMGSWVLYGLGAQNRDLPGFVTVKPQVILGGARNYASSFLPSVYQGTPIGTMSKALKTATVANTKHPKLSLAAQRRQLDFLQSLNRGTAERQPANDQLEGVIE